MRRTSRKINLASFFAIAIMRGSLISKRFLKMMSQAKPFMSRALSLAATMLLSIGCVQADPTVVEETPPPEADWLHADGISGTWGGMRTALQARGIEVSGSYSADIWGNTYGGLKTGSVYTGLLTFGAAVDLEKAVGWSGASVSTTWLWLSGRDASQDLVGNFQTISTLAGFNTLRMYNLWFQQNFFEDKVSIRLGQIAADSEFVLSDYSGLFLNGTFGWPPFAYMNLPQGGPGYPMGTLGGRLALKPVDWFTFQTAVFQGDVFAQNVNRHGFRWSLDAQTGYTFFNEAQFRWNHRAEEAGLPGQLKSGVWFQTGTNADALAESTNSGNGGCYVIIDQMLYRKPAEPAAGAENDGKSAVGEKRDKSFKSTVALEKSDQGLGWFGHLAFAPADRSFISFYFDTGLTYKGLIPTRDKDTVGLGFGYAQLSNGARNLLQSDGGASIAAQMVVELTYQARITPWFSVQPDVQYIINPSATTGLNNALVLGARASLVF